MELNQKTYWVCLPCSRKYGYRLQNNSTWHYARCVQCHVKDTVADQIKVK